MLKATREQANAVKEKIIAYLIKAIQEENLPPLGETIPGCEEQISQPTQQYKCFVGKGNNSILVRTLFKTRFWWLLHDKEELDKVNFMWTQLRKNPIMDALPCRFIDKQSQLRTADPAGAQTPGSKKLRKPKKKLQSSAQSLEAAEDKREEAKANQLSVKLYNKLEDNFHLSNKKAMFLNLRLYYEALGRDVFAAVPVTFHVKEGLEDPEFVRFKAFYLREEEEAKRQRARPEESGAQRKNIWIIKPGENTNRGNGITVSKDYEEIRQIVLESTANRKRTCIIQKYIHNPLLIVNGLISVLAILPFVTVTQLLLVNLDYKLYAQSY